MLVKKVQFLGVLTPLYLGAGLPPLLVYGSNNARVL
jgi:hypothetical protein